MVFDNQISSPSSFTICIDPSQKKLSHIPLTPIQRSPIANHFFGVTLFLFSPVLPQFQTNPFINQILIISFKHNSFRSNTQTLSNQAHSNKFFFFKQPKSTVMREIVIGEREGDQTSKSWERTGSELSVTYPSRERSRLEWVMVDQTQLGFLRYASLLQSRCWWRLQFQHLVLKTQSHGVERERERETQSQWFGERARHE